MSNEKSTVSFSKKYGLLFADLAMLVIFLLPTPTDLTTTGHRMLGILIFAIIVWITEPVSYPVSAAIIATLMFLCLGMNPNPQDPAKLLGIKVGLPLTIIGYLIMLFFAQTYWHMLGIF